MRQAAIQSIKHLGRCLLAALPLTVLADGGFTDIDIRQITAAAAAAVPGSISRYDEASWVGCPNTIEDKCTREAVLLIDTPKGQKWLIVSNVSDGWIVSQKQQALMVKARRDRDQELLSEKCRRQWDELTRPGQLYEHWSGETYRKWWDEHCKVSDPPPPKPDGIDSSLRGGTSSTP